MLSAIIINHLPVKLLKPTLESLDFADEVIVIHDSNSIHQPPKSKGHLKVFLKPLTSFSDQRNLALKKAKSPWVLFVDSDETVPKKLGAEIKKKIKTTNLLGFYLKRQDIILGKKLKFGETGSIKILRLAKRNAGRFKRSVHETWEIKGGVGELRNPLLHHKKNLTNSFIEKISNYGLLDTKELIKENKPFSYLKVFTNPIGKHLQNYIVRRGFLDGLLGLFHAYLMSVQSLSVRIFQWQDTRLPLKTVKL